MAVTTNYSFNKRKIGHPVRDDDIGDNLDLIDAAIFAGVNPLDSAKIIVGNGANLATGVAMSGDITVDNAGVTTIGADKVANSMLENMTRGTLKVGGAADAPTDLDAKTDGQILIGDATDIASVAMSGDVTITNTGATTIGANKVTIAALEAALQKGLITVGDIDITETTVWKIEFPFKVTIDKVNTVVTTTLSAHETTVALKNNAGTSMTDGVVTIGASAAKGVVNTASPSAHNVIAAGEDIQFVSSGACSTGKVIATVHYTRTA